MRDFPPTPSLVAMRLKHTKQSVAYNMGHFNDHMKDTQVSIKKMATVDPIAAKAHQAQVASALQAMLNRTKNA